jgi:hypothetical protein
MHACVRVHACGGWQNVAPWWVDGEWSSPELPHLIMARRWGQALLEISCEVLTIFSQGQRAQTALLKLGSICECFLHTFVASWILCLGFGLCVLIFWESDITIYHLWDFVDVFGICATDPKNPDCISMWW